MYTYVKIKIKCFNLKKKKKRNCLLEPGTVAHTSNLSSWKVKAKTCEFKVILSYRDKFEASLAYVRP